MTARAKLVALNLPPAAILAAAAHAGYLDQFVADSVLGAWCGGIALVFLWAVLALAVGRDDLSRWIGARLTLLGMAGTLHGFYIAMGSIAGGDTLDGLKTVIPALLSGMAVALLTTVAGLVSKIWLDVLMRWAR